MITPSIIISYRARGYSQEDLTQLKENLSSLGPTRVRGKALPESGGSSEVQILLLWVGIKIFEVMFEKFVESYYEKVSKAVTQFIEQRKNSRQASPELTILVSYDDTDIEIYPNTDQDFDNLRVLFERIHLRLSEQPLNEHNICKIIVGVEFEGGNWSPPDPFTGTSLLSRYWGICTDELQDVTLIYDTEINEVFSVRPH